MIGDLPSGEHAAEFLAQPTLARASTLAGDAFGRAVLIWLGMQLFGRRARSNFGLALAGSGMIEVFVLGFMMRKAQPP